MSSRHNIDPQVRGFYFASSGRDAFDGQTDERPKQSIQAAIDETSSLVPPVSPTALAQVSASQGGEFSESFSLPDGCQFDAQDVTIVVDSPLACELGSFLVCKLSGLTNTQDSSVVFEADAKFSVGVRILFTGVFGDDCIGYNLLGTGESLFMATDQMRLNGERSIGFMINCTCPDPIDINADAIIFGADDTTVMVFDPLTSDDRCIVNLSTIIKGPGVSGTTGYIAEDGLLIVVQSGLLQADTAIHVKDGASVILDCDNVQGDIIIDSGGILSADIVRFAGTITNNGTLEGQIGDTLFDPIKIIALDEPDTTALVTHSLQGLNGGDSQSFYSTRTPIGNITGNPGDLTFRNDGVNSQVLQHLGSSANNTDWRRFVTAGGIGDIGFDSNVTATVISVINTYVAITTTPGWSLSALSEDFELHTDSISLKYVGDISIKVLITAGVLLDSLNNKAYELGIFLNGVLMSRSEFTVDIRQNPLNVSHTVLNQLSTDDLLELRVKNITDTSNPTIVDAYITATKVS